MDKILEKLLTEYPAFFDKTPGTNHYKWVDILASGIRQVQRDAKIVGLAKNLRRPIQIWKTQLLGYNYQMNFRVEIPEMVSIEIFQDDGTLLYDFIIPEGEESFSFNFQKASEELIPSDKYYIEINDKDGNVFKKGFPENDTPLGDIYDKDAALDKLGENYGVPRRTYDYTRVEYDWDYANTDPPYCNSETEWDACYEARLFRHIENIKARPLPTTEIKRLFSIDPTIEGRWRHVCKMNQDLQDSKFMSTEEWNSAVFDVSVNLDEVPLNIKIPSTLQIQNVIDKSFPLSKKGYFEMTITESVESEIMGLADTIRFKMASEYVRNTLNEAYALIVESNITEQAVLAENMSFKSHSPERNEGLYEEVNAYEFAVMSNPQNRSDFDNQGTHSHTWAYTDGTSDFLALYYRYLDTWKDGPNTSSQGNENYVNWVDLVKINSGVVGAATCTTTSNTGNGRYSEAIFARNFGFNVPSDAIITGVLVRILRSCSRANAVKDGQLYLLNTSANATGTNNASNTYYSTSTQEVWYGGSDKLFGCALTPAWVNHSNFGVHYRIRSEYNGSSTTNVAWIAMAVSYLLASGVWTSQTIVKAVNQISWGKFRLGDLYYPGNTNVYTEIIKASDGTVLKTIPAQNNIDVDISDIENTDIKLKWHARSYVNGNSPHIKSMKLTNKKEYTLK